VRKPRSKSIYLDFIPKIRYLWDNPSKEVAAMGELFQPAHLLILMFFGLPFSVLVVLPFWVIFKKAGFPAALSLLMLVPMANIIALYVLAFSRWRSTPAA
jgi:hypothetical protein